MGTHIILYLKLCGTLNMRLSSTANTCSIDLSDPPTNHQNPMQLMIT
jgi:hypothetical protein